MHVISLLYEKTSKQSVIDEKRVEKEAEDIKKIYMGIYMGSDGIGV